MYNGGNVLFDKRKYYDALAPILQEWYKQGAGGSVSYEVEMELVALTPWSFWA